MSRSEVKKMPESEVSGYRNIDRLSYSALKMYDTNRIEFKKKYIDKEEVEDEESEYVRMGNIVDVHHTDYKNYDNYFVVASSTKPTGQLLTFTGFLLKNTLRDTVDGILNSSFEQRAKEAYEQLKEWNGGKLRDKFETVVDKFKSEASGYFSEILKGVGKTIITVEEAEMGKNIANKLRYSESTKEIIEAEGLTKFPILFNLGDYEMKMEADKIILDHKSKTIFPFDIKITNFVEDFVFNSFLKKKYYIQSSLYKFGIEQWKETTDYKDYKVENLAFIVGDYKNIYDPLVYRTSDQHYEQGFNGFFVGNTYYRGIMEILENIKFSKENDVWGMSMYNFKRKGVVYIPEFKNSRE